jgi:drug/metabolite transporter (DMT)-like permease
VIDKSGRPGLIAPTVSTLVYTILCLIWGSTWLAIKIGLSQAPPFTTAALRFLLATAVLSLISLARSQRYPSGFKALLSLAYPGFHMYFLSYALVYLGEQYIDSAACAVLFASYPFFVAALSWWKYRTERLGPVAWFGMAVGLAGVVVISIDSFQASADIFTGTVLVIGASLAAAYGAVIHKHRFSKVDIVIAANVQMIFGGLFLILGAVILEDWSSFSPTIEAVGSIVYLALAGTVIAFLGYYWLLRHMRLTVVALIAFITPLVAILIGVFFAGESFTPLTVVGSGLILGGVLLVVRKER